MTYKKMAKGGSAGSRGKMSEKARRLSDTKLNMLRKEKAAKESRMKMILDESGKPISQRDMDYIEKGPKFFKDGGSVSDRDLELISAQRGKAISDRDLELISDSLVYRPKGDALKKIKPPKRGGPSKSGSRPSAVRRYKDGGAVKGMGAAIQGGKYTGCK